MFNNTRGPHSSRQACLTQLFLLIENLYLNNVWAYVELRMDTTKMHLEDIGIHVFLILLFMCVCVCI